MTASLHAGSGETSPTRIAEIETRVNAATKGPWGWCQTAEKGYGANVGAGCFAQNDTACITPLSGNLNDRIDDFYVEQGIAHSGHQNAASDADFIANARQDIPWLLGELHFAQTFAPPNALGAHTMAGLVEGAREYRDRLQVLESALRAASDREAALREALGEIAKGAGRFSVDPLTHASNVIENLTTLAANALSGVSSDEQTNE